MTANNKAITQHGPDLDWVATQDFKRRKVFIAKRPGNSARPAELLYVSHDGVTARRVIRLRTAPAIFAFFVVWAGCDRVLREPIPTRFKCAALGK
jgi:hypothetical protein